MILLPVISRELRSAARHGFTYYLRTIGAGAAMLVALLFGVGHGFTQDHGSGLFAGLHLTLFLAIWIFVPVLTADSISRERREGTLGLLFLTGLRASNIVIAKGLANGLRALTLALAVIPVIMLPFLMGGVTWSHALRCGLVNFSALCLALAAGLLASSWTKTWNRAVLLAMMFALLFVVLFSFGLLWLAWTVAGITVPVSAGLSEFLFAVAIQLGFIPEYILTWYPWTPSFLSGLSASRLLVAMLGVSVVSVVFLFLVIVLAGIKTRRGWQEEPPSQLQIWFGNTFCSPIILGRFYRRWLRRKLEANPIGWLEQRTWSGRLVTWGWFAVVVSLYSAVSTDRNFLRGYSGLQQGIAWLMAGSMAITAAGSFRRERDTGVMELLLVSSLSERKIVWGRLRGLWGQFIPAASLLFGVWIYFGNLLPDTRSTGMFWLYGCTFLTLPVIGLYYSLSCRNLITGFLATLSIGIFMPLALSFLGTRTLWLISMTNSFGVYYQPPGASDFAGWAGLCQLVTAACCGQFLLMRLKQRSFPLVKSDK
jgi:ABC-type transport system involved in multi-copper enzyme maturation permease subunit